MSLDGSCNQRRLLIRLSMFWMLPFYVRSQIFEFHWTLFTFSPDSLYFLSIVFLISTTSPQCDLLLSFQVVLIQFQMLPCQFNDLHCHIHRPIMLPSQFRELYLNKLLVSDSLSFFNWNLKLSCWCIGHFIWKLDPNRLL